MKKIIIYLCLLFIAVSAIGVNAVVINKKPEPQVLPAQSMRTHWFVLYRKSNVEYLYYGVPGEPTKSDHLKTFQVKSGIPGKRPTPLPSLLGRDYWLITNKEDSHQNPETSPYFLTLDVPVGEEAPFGPTPYLECEGQCDWVLPGAFGLHGVNGDLAKLSTENEGSSGCIRHKDEDISYLFNILNPQEEEIRYYIKDI